MTAPTVIPTTATELEEMLGDRKRVNALFDEGPDKFGEFIKAYANKCLSKDLDILAQVKEETQRCMAEWLRDNEVEQVKRLNLGGTRTPWKDRPAAYDPEAAGVVLDGKFKSTGDLMKALYGERNRDHTASARLTELRNAYSSSVPAEGGFLVPEEFRAELLRVSLESSLVRSRARVIPMGVPRIKFPIIDATSNASSVYGGIIGYWTEEGATLTASSATFGSIVLDAQKLTAYAEIPNELLNDSVVSVSGFVNQAYPEAISWFEDVAFTRGTGVGEPLGFLHSGNTAAVSVSKESGQAAATIVWENIVKMYSRMLPTSLGRAVWVAHINTFPELATMALSVGTGGGPVWLNNGAEGPPVTILGRPVVFTEKADTVGTVGDINFVDLGYYLIGDRQQMSAMTSEHFKFNTDTTAYRVIERVDGRPWLKSAITPHKGADTLSPFVKLATRS